MRVSVKASCRLLSCSEEAVCVYLTCLTGLLWPCWVLSKQDCATKNKQLEYVTRGRYKVTVQCVQPTIDLVLLYIIINNDIIHYCSFIVCVQTCCLVNNVGLEADLSGLLGCGI